MRNKKKLLKLTKVIIIILMILIDVASISVYYAATIYYDSSNVGYSNTATGIDADTVQGALNIIRSRVTSNKIVKMLAKRGRAASVGGASTPAITTNGYHTSTCGSDPCHIKTTPYNYTTTGDYEIDVDISLYNQTKAWVGNSRLKFINSDYSDPVFEFYFVDNTTGTTRIRTDINMSGLQIYTATYTSGIGIAGTTHWKIIRSGTTVTVYREGTAVTTTTHVGTLTITDIEADFAVSSTSSYIPIPMQLSNIYVGPIRS